MSYVRQSTLIIPYSSGPRSFWLRMGYSSVPFVAQEIKSYIYV